MAGATRDGLGLRFGALSEHTVQICADAQRLFAEETAWHTPWLRRVLPNIEQVARAHATRTLDKATSSPWLDPALDRLLQETGTEAVVIRGGETDACVLATVIGAVDRGFRLFIVAKGACSSADKTRDATVRLFCSRFGEQIEIATAAQMLEAWPAS